MCWLWRPEEAVLRSYRFLKPGWTFQWPLGSCYCTQSWLMCCPSRLSSTLLFFPSLHSLGPLVLFCTLSATIFTLRLLRISFSTSLAHGSLVLLQLWEYGASVCSMSWLNCGGVWSFQCCFGGLPIRLFDSSLPFTLLNLPSILSDFPRCNNLFMDEQDTDIYCIFSMKIKL